MNYLRIMNMFVRIDSSLDLCFAKPSLATFSLETSYILSLYIFTVHITTKEEQIIKIKIGAQKVTVSCINKGVLINCHFLHRELGFVRKWILYLKQNLGIIPFSNKMILSNSAKLV